MSWITGVKTVMLEIWVGWGCILYWGMLERRWVGEVLFASDIDSPARERATNGECELKTRSCDAVRCVRSRMGGFIRWFLDNLGCRPPKFCENKNRKEVRYGNRMHVLLQTTAQAKNKKSYCRRRRTVTLTNPGMILDSHASCYHYSNGSRIQSSTSY